MVYHRKIFVRFVFFVVKAFIQTSKKHLNLGGFFECSDGYPLFFYSGLTEILSVSVCDD